MSYPKEPQERIITRGKEQPPLEFGPERIHYNASVALPQAYLTLFSVLQGLAFGVLLVSIPLPRLRTWDAYWNFFVQQYCYLPSLLSLGLLIYIWFLLVNVTLNERWPHSFSQISLVVLLTVCEIFAIQQVQYLHDGAFSLGVAVSLEASLSEEVAKC